MTLEKAKKDENEYKLDMSEAKRPKNKKKKKNALNNIEMLYKA